MKKRILSLALVLALCMTLAVPAFADETTGTTVTLPESPDVPGVTASISNVLSVHTVALKQTVGYDHEADAPIEALIPTTVYTLAPTGAVLTVTNESEDYLFPGYDGCYTFQDGCYVTNPEFEGYGQCASFAPGTSSDYSLDCSADPANSDIYSLWICGGLSICYTYADLSDRSVEADPPETFGAYVNDFLLLNLTHAETRSVILDGSELDITLYYAAPNVYCLLTDYAGDPSFAPLMCTYYPLEGQVNAYDSAEMTDFPYTSLTITPDGEYGQFYRVWSSTSSVFIMLDPAFRTEPTPEEPAVPDEPAAPVFADVAPGDYFADAVFWAIDRGITNGTSDTTFSPKELCTKAHILTFLWRAYGKPDDASALANPFADVKENDYFYGPALWAYSLEMTDGHGSALEPGSPCTRASTVMFMWQAAGRPEVSTEINFTDVPADAEYAQAVAWAVENGVTNGTSDTTFSPDDTCTRGQIVTFLYRAMAK